MPGSPIRKSWDHSLVDSSPRPIVASHVLHRLLVPRHPPFALDNLTTKNKMLASTVQFSTNNQPTTRTVPHQTPKELDPQAGSLKTVWETRSCLDSSETTTLFHEDCSFRTQQGAYRRRSAAPANSVPTTPLTGMAVLGFAGRCRPLTSQCLRL
jgi:hypothetical protein